MQIRPDKPFNDRKYFWLSSKDVPKGGVPGTGASPGSPIHFVGDPAAKRVFITEGGLKGSVAHSLTGYTFACLPGVNSIGELRGILGMLKANGTEVVVEAFDTDKHTNEKVGAAAKALKVLIEEFEFNHLSADWADKSLKGIDDYYFDRRLKQQNHIFTVSMAPA